MKKTYLTGNNSMFVFNRKVIVATFFIILVLCNYEFANAYCTNWHGWGCGPWLQNGVPINNLSFNYGDPQCFSFETPDAVSQINIKAWGGKGKALLEINCMDPDRDWESYFGNNNFTQNNPACSCWVLDLYASDPSITGWSIKATYKTSGSSPGPSPTLIPDLTGQWISLIQTCKNTKKGVKCQIKGKLAIQNIGNKNASSSRVRFYLSDDTIYNDGDILLKQVSSGSVKIGKNTTKALSFALPVGETAAGKYIIAVIDADNSVPESNETNNSAITGPIL